MWRSWESKSTRVARTAATWRVKMLEPESEAEVADFEAWLLADPEHLRAFNAATDLARISLRARPTSGVAGSRYSPPREAFAAAAAIALLVLATLWITRPSDPAYAAVVNPGTAVRAVALRSGTRITLDADTRLEIVSLSDGDRVRLLTGRARFAVQSGHPLLITTTKGVVTADEAVIDVTVERDVMQVSVIGGEAQISASAGEKEVRARRTQSVSIDDRRILTVPVKPLDTSWPLARIKFDAVPLSEIIALANRTGDVRLRAGDADVGRLRVTGVLDIRDTRRLARKLAAALDLDAIERGATIVLTR